MGCEKDLSFVCEAGVEVDKRIGSMGKDVDVGVELYLCQGVGRVAFGVDRDGCPNIAMV